MAGVSVETIKRLERIRGPVNASPLTVSMLRQALSQLDVIFFFDERDRLCVRQGGEVGSLSAEGVTSGADDEPLFRAIYHSVATPDTMEHASTVVDSIVEEALILNSQLAITGALLYAGGRFAQVLEGPRNNVSRVLGQIAMDRRHNRFTPVDRREAQERLFPDWVLCAPPLFPPSQSLTFNPAAMCADDYVNLLLDLRDNQRRAAGLS
jgi:hypothetical protein